MTAFWWRIIDNADASPPDLWELFWQSRLTAVGENWRPVYVGMTWRRFSTTWQRGRGDRTWRKLTVRWAVWGRCACRSREHRTEGTRATRDGELGRSRRL